MAQRPLFMLAGLFALALVAGTALAQTQPNDTMTASPGMETSEMMEPGMETGEIMEPAMEAGSDTMMEGCGEQDHAMEPGMESDTRPMDPDMDASDDMMMAPER